MRATVASAGRRRNDVAATERTHSAQKRTRTRTRRSHRGNVRGEMRAPNVAGLVAVAVVVFVGLARHELRRRRRPPRQQPARRRRRCCGRCAALTRTGRPPVQRCVDVALGDVGASGVAVAWARRRAVARPLARIVRGTAHRTGARRRRVTHRLRRPRRLCACVSVRLSVLAFSCQRRGGRLRAVPLCALLSRANNERRRRRRRLVLHRRAAAVLTRANVNCCGGGAQQRRRPPPNAPARPAPASAGARPRDAPTGRGSRPNAPPPPTRTAAALCAVRRAPT